LTILGIAIALIQIADIALHVATSQAEPIRIASNAFILLGLAFGITRKANGTLISVCSIGIYAVMNIIFVAQHGLTNPEQGGEPRTALILLVLLTVVLSAMLTWLARKRSVNARQLPL
jgi:surface polysaccharide O-acyltransferase-like enzyme